MGEAPTRETVLQLTHTLADRIGRFLERQGLLERNKKNSYLSEEALDEGLMSRLLGHSVTYRIAVGPHTGRKVFTLQTLLPSDELGADKVAGFSLNAGVAARMNERNKLDFMAKLAALVPKPRVNLTRFHGVFAPNSKHRAQVTPAKRGKGSQAVRPEEATDQTMAEQKQKGTDQNDTYLSDASVCAVTHQLCRQALIKNALCCCATLGGLRKNR